MKTYSKEDLIDLYNDAIGAGIVDLVLTAAITVYDMQIKKVPDGAETYSFEEWVKIHLDDTIPKSDEKKYGVIKEN